MRPFEPKGRTTTVRVSQATHARLAALIDEHHLGPVENVVSLALDLLERELFWQSADRALSSMTDEMIAEDEAEMAA